MIKRLLKVMRRLLGHDRKVSDVLRRVASVLLQSHARISQMIASMTKEELRLCRSTTGWVKAHFQLKQSQARVNVSARHRELFNTELGLYGLPEHRQMTVTFDPTQTWFDVEQCRGYPTVAL